MAREQTVVVPDLGNVKDVEVIDVLVQVGDVVAADASVLTLESDKAAMDVPSPFAGTVQSLAIKKGDRVSTGAIVLTLLVENSAGSTPAGAPKIEVTPTPTVAPQTAVAPVATPAPQPVATRAPVAISASDGNALPHASPSIRRFARELGADLTQIKGTGTKGRIVKGDVQNFIKQRLSQPAQSSLGLNLSELPPVDFGQFGAINTQPLSRIKKLSGANLHRNWVTIPHITNHDLADITDLENFRQGLQKEAERRGVKITPLPLLIKALVAALQAHPVFNSSLDASGENLILKQYYHFGIAVDTEEGLVVPVLRDVDKKGIFELAQALADLSERARKRKLKKDELQGGCFTISSLGGIGGTAFTPIINAPEVAILGVSRSSMQPVYQNSQFVPRLMLPLSLSYDHRVIDGAQAARFLADLCSMLCDLRRILL